MRQLMISLDKTILDTGSASARRMIEYGKHDELFIIVPANKEMQVDLSPTVHVNSVGGNKACQFFGLYWLGLKLIKEKNIQHITSQDPFFIGLIGWRLSRRAHVPLEVQLHGDFYGSNYYRRSGIANAVRYYIGLFVIAHADRVRCVGERIKRSLVVRGISEEKIIVQPVRVNTEYIKGYQPKFDIHAKYPDARIIFLCLGRLDPVKNIPWLVKVFAEVSYTHPNVLLLIVGDGVERDRIVQLIKQLGMEKNIKMEGWTSDPYSYLKSADCLLFPSLSEGYGMVVVEALAAGRRVIMNDVGVANFEVVPSENVAIVPVGDKKQFKNAIESVCG
ncbi:MAG: glycosyltransferase [Candidatus Magasanikbacteria bacterium]|nr:glycosyltransferase [Candidatus Magasanikbacteria bacterium]